MSLEGVTAAAARVIALAPAVKAAYAADPLGMAGVVRTPADIADTPVVLVNYEGFELTHPGKPETLIHTLRADIWVRGRTSSEGEAVYLPVATQIIAAFRTHAGLFGQAIIAKVIRGGPPRPEEINEQPFIILPVWVRVTELTVNQYELGPGS